MTTKLAGELKREIDIDGTAFTLTLSPEGMKITPKGHRRGHELKWKDIVTGDAELAAALNASVKASG